MALAERGAEAVVTACEWHGRPAVVKHRNRRSYRHPDLETRLVVERLRAEARLLERAAGAGLPVPALYAVAPAAATPILLNLCLIGAIMGLANVTETSGHALAWGVAAAGVGSAVDRPCNSRPTGVSCICSAAGRSAS